MPKAFSEKEKTAIRAHLCAVGLRHFAKAGVRAARVEDICRETGIAKGSFYNFFPSKEDLFMTIADARDLGHKADMRTYLMNGTQGAAATLEGLFDFMMQRIETDPVLRIVQDSGEMAHVLRKVSPPMVEENLRRDRAFVAEVSGILKQRFGMVHASPGALEGLMSLMLALGFQRQVIETTGTYANTLALLKSLFVHRLLKGEDHD